MTSIIHRLLIIDDDTAHLASLNKIFKRMGLEVIAVPRAYEALTYLETTQFSAVLCDFMLPDLDGIELLKEMKQRCPELEIVVMTAFGTIERAVHAMREGAYDFITKPFRKAEIERVIRRVLERYELIIENETLKAQLAAVRTQEPNIHGMIGHAPAFHHVLDLAKQAAPSEATVLLMGESGTGKEVFARAIHRLSLRVEAPFITVNCGALPEGIIEAELFGVERGAYTGAVQSREGRFSRAHGGTLFLDEVGEMPLHLQVKLLRVLQSGEFERVGGDRTLYTDCRMIAATNIDLVQAITEGKFREDLFYRLNVIPIILPSLRERSDDIPLLAKHFLHRFCKRHQKQLNGFSAKALRLLTQHTWPGNVRELENMVERMVVLSKGPWIEQTDLPFVVDKEISLPEQVFMIPLGVPLQEVERKLIHQTLAFTHGDKQKAAQLLGIATRTIYRKLQSTINEEKETLIKKD